MSSRTSNDRPSSPITVVLNWQAALKNESNLLQRKPDSRGHLRGRTHGVAVGGYLVESDVEAHGEVPLQEPSRAPAGIDRAGRGLGAGIHSRGARAEAQITPPVRRSEVERQLRRDRLKRRVRVRRRPSHFYVVGTDAKSGRTKAEQIDVGADIDAKSTCRHDQPSRVPTGASR